VVLIFLLKGESHVPSQALVRSNAVSLRIWPSHRWYLVALAARPIPHLEVMGEPSAEMRKITDALRFARLQHDQGLENEDEITHWEAELARVKKEEADA
jgi:hypothetical protein